VALLTLVVSSCGVADVPEARTEPAMTPASATPAGQSTQPAALAAAEALCRPADQGTLRARLQGAIDAEIDWTAPATPQCMGGPRPGGGGIRLVYKGTVGTEPLLVIIGIVIDPAQQSGRNVPASITVVREGSGQFFATQGDDKCALDEVVQEPVAGVDGRFRLSGRGYCTQPARAVGDAEGAVLVSRFDVDAVVDRPKEP
jgi:hypothetical protein